MVKRGSRPLLILALMSILIISVSGSALMEIWKAPWLGKQIIITETINSTTSIPFDAAIYRTDLYQTQGFTSTLIDFTVENYTFIDSCALVYLEGDIPSELAIRADITVLKNGDVISIPWSFNGTFACYWMDGIELRITPLEIFTQDEDEAIPDKDHCIPIPIIPSYQNPDILGEPNAIILEFDFSSIIEVGIYSIDVELSILGSE